MTEEAACSICIHASACHISLILLFADIPDFRISSLRMHENHSAYTCIWSHGITLCQLDTKSVTMVMSVASASAAVTMAVIVNLIALAEKAKNVFLQCVVRTA